MWNVGGRCAQKSPSTGDNMYIPHRKGKTWDSNPQPLNSQVGVFTTRPKHPKNVSTEKLCKDNNNKKTPKIILLLCRYKLQYNPKGSKARIFLSFISYNDLRIRTNKNVKKKSRLLYKVTQVKGVKVVSFIVKTGLSGWLQDSCLIHAVHYKQEHHCGCPKPLNHCSKCSGRTVTPPSNLQTNFKQVPYNQLHHKHLMFSVLCMCRSTLTIPVTFDLLMTMGSQRKMMWHHTPYITQRILWKWKRNTFL